MAKYVWGGCLTLAMLFAVRTADAASEFQFFFDQSSYTVDPGDTVVVEVFLREIVTPTNGPSQLGPLGPGIFSIGSLVTSSNSGVEIISAVGSPLFDDDPSTFSADQALLWPGNVFLPDPTATENPSGSGIYEISVGQVTFRGLTPGALANLAAASPVDPTIEYTNLANATVLDDLIAPATATLRVTGTGAIPEPSSLACLSLLAGIACGTVLWRRQAVTP